MKRYDIDSSEFRRALALHLEKCEIEFIAEYGKNGGYIPAVKSGAIPCAEIESYMRSLGFRLKLKKEPVCGADQWADYYGGVSVGLANGFVVNMRNR